MGAPNVLAYCRAGFEKECAQEITALARESGVEGFVKARPDSAFAIFHPHDEAAGLDFARGVDAGCTRLSPAGDSLRRIAHRPARG